MLLNCNPSLNPSLEVLFPHLSCGDLLPFSLSRTWRCPTEAAGEPAGLAHAPFPCQEGE